MAALPAVWDCEWCGEPNRRPRGCGAPDPFCLDEIAFKCDVFDDHRRCGPECPSYDTVVQAAEVGRVCSESSGKPYVVVCTVCDPWSERPFDALQQAKPFRVKHGRSAHGLERNAAKAAVFVIRADAVVL